MPKHVDHEQRRAELVRAVWRIIAEQGIDEVTIREIAREAGFSAGALAHYFENKDDLLVNAFRISHEQINARYAEKTDTERASEALRAVLLDNLPLDKQRELETRIEMSFWARSLRNPAIRKIQMSEATYLQDLIARLVGGSMEEGELDRTGPEIDEIVDLFAALIDGLSLHALLYPRRMTRKRQQRIMELVLELLAADEADGGAGDDAALDD